jgi:hypothetical protein
MDNIKSVMASTGMGELQAYRHLQDRRKAQALYKVERRRRAPAILDSEQANEALRLWQLARLMAKRGENLAARAYYRECLAICGRR